jgi:hypothetical protein
LKIFNSCKSSINWIETVKNDWWEIKGRKKEKKRLKKNHLNYKRLTFFKYEKESFENESIK